MPRVDKLVVTNLSRLRRKYGPGWSRVQEALHGLVRADASRGLTTLVVGLDDARAVRRHGLAPVGGSTRTEMTESTTLTGRVARQRIGRGSKSEHVAIVLRTGGRTLWLRRRGGHAFHDPVLHRLIGSTLKGEGTMHGNTFIVDRLAAVGHARSRRAGRTRKKTATRTGRRAKTKPVVRLRAAAAPDPFRHVVLLALENRSFDHMLGALQAVIGVDGVPPNAPARTNPDIAGNPVGQLPVAGLVVDPDPKHETPNVLNQVDDSNGRFVKDYQRAYPEISAAQKQAVMAYHSLGSLSALHALGQAFAVCDKWFCSVPGPTWTNRLFMMSGTSLGRVKMPEGLFQPNLHHYEQPSVFRRVEEAGRSLRIYFGDFPLALLLADRRKPGPALRFRPLERFFADVAGKASAFPDFALIEPHYMLAADDDHPPHNVSAGQRLVTRVYEALRANQELWESTLLVIVYDEHGGFYDHVSPPPGKPPDGHHEEYTFDRLGLRVPALLVSPWIPPQVVSTVCDHTALLRSLQIRWGLGRMGARVAEAPDILGGLRLAPAARQDTPERLLRATPMAAARTPRRSRVPAPLNDHQRAIVAFSAYLDTETTAPAALKVRATARSMRGPDDARRVAEERAKRYLAQLAGKTRRRR